LGADAAKSGMLVSDAMINAVADVLAAKMPRLPLVVDPVMVATGGGRLLAEDAVATLKARLFPLATLVTPNIPEAETLSGARIESREAMAEGAQMLLALGCRAVLLKGGHLAGSSVVDLLVSAAGTRAFEYPRLETRNTHGTGCTLASAIATGLAQGLALADAVARARAYLQEAIRTAPGFGHGRGPLNHAHTVRPFDGN
ncbi:MAG TPA: bifunctional hydroxymethylpyrimidine kinase/phosphomethylpyrimidine kinase, partial [Alphaproteobacteria bacterium]|nr:bifunctional hydroxymethylpyrimidine kinase/phosphomethylpyrimidine kinase [Alphaproteobacteria bacterium]